MTSPTPGTEPSAMTDNDRYLMGWIQRMTATRGNWCWDARANGGKGQWLRWPEAIMRHVYGPDWKSGKYPASTPDEVVAAAKEWEAGTLPNGGWPDWSAQVRAQL